MSPGIVVSHAPTGEQVYFTEDEMHAPEATHEMEAYVERVAKRLHTPD